MSPRFFVILLTENQILSSRSKKVYFAATTPLTGNELFRSDGTQEGTSIFLDASNGTRSSFPLHLFVFQTHLYFTADDGNHGRELWRTDGTPGGAHMVMDICTGIQGSDPSNFTIFKNTYTLRRMTAYTAESCGVCDRTLQA